MPPLAIEIPFDPNIVTIGGLLLTWHGLFTAVGILAGVQISLRLARTYGYDEDRAYTLALIGIPSGILGARLLFVAENWDFYSQNLLDILAITEGGISIWGAVIGGVLGPLIFALARGYEVPLGLDIAAPGLILGMGLGRIGDLINGEHLSRATSLPWGVIYTDPDSPAFAHSLLVGAHHPATTYEMLGDFVILGALLWLKAGPLRRRDGVTFTVFLAAYSVMRYLVSMLRVDSADTVLPGATVPQLVSLIVLAVALPLGAWFWMRSAKAAAPPSGTLPPAGRVPVRRNR